MSSVAEARETTLEARQTRLKEGTSRLVEQYAGLLRAGQVHDDVRQQVSELHTAVLADSMLHAAGDVMDLADELRCEENVNDHEAIAAEMSSIATAHTKFADDGELRLRAVEAEMCAALHELETNYYNCSVTDDGQPRS